MKRREGNREREGGGSRFLVQFLNPDDTKDTVSVWARTPEDALESVRSWLEESQDVDLASSESFVERIGGRPSPGDVGVTDSAESVNHRRYSSDGKRLSTLVRAQPEHLRRLTDKMRTDPSPDWALLRRLLMDEQVSPGKAVVVGLQSEEEMPQSGTTVVCDGRRVFSYFPVAHPRMENGLPVIRSDGSIETLPGPALIELPSLEPWNALVQAGFRLLEED